MMRWIDVRIWMKRRAYVKGKHCDLCICVDIRGWIGESDVVWMVMCYCTRKGLGDIVIHGEKVQEKRKIAPRWMSSVDMYTKGCARYVHE